LSWKKEAKELYDELQFNITNNNAQSSLKELKRQVASIDNTNIKKSLSDLAAAEHSPSKSNKSAESIKNFRKSGEIADFNKATISYENSKRSSTNIDLDELKKYSWKIWVKWYCPYYYWW